MPFNRKATGRLEDGVPAEIDFDRLWRQVYRPVLTDLGYLAVRADCDVGASIIREMIQRLVLGDLVIADLTLPNPNVYYEVGVRHAAVEDGCLLTTAEWARSAFDLAQVRQIRYPLADGNVAEPAAAQARAVLGERMRAAMPGASPVFESVAGYPRRGDDGQRQAFQELVTDLDDFDTDVTAIYHLPAQEQRGAAEDVARRYRSRPAVRQADALQLIRLLRDFVDPRAVLSYIGSLPTHLVRHPLVWEQRCLALGHAGQPALAAGELQDLIRTHGPTAERLGLLGGRYKQLLEAATSEADRQRFLQRAIDSYAAGMQADLNDYYPASNLPRLYRLRGEPGDEELAHDAEVVTKVACHRAVELGIADRWVRPTLLGLAFARGDVEESRRLLREVRREGPHAWELRSLLADLRVDAERHEPAVQAALVTVLDALHRLLPEPGSADGSDR
ncbi:hypothetical protein GCM10023225_03600 [Kineococcus glutinatus]|uniref:DUF4071 domain-containing protein n=2 Tax=Kineococcus glutinatus TaxID=1070872 RepID=A0ABP9H846_9ACTN